MSDKKKTFVCLFLSTVAVVKGQIVVEADTIPEAEEKLRELVEGGKVVKGVICQKTGKPIKNHLGEIKWEVDSISSNMPRTELTWLKELDE